MTATLDTKAAERVRVLIVDDDVLVRTMLTRELDSQQDIEIVGAAADAYAARDAIVRLRPDVVTLDLEMPRMDGLTFLRKLMRYNPVPVVVVSSMTPDGSESAVRALEAGAVAVLSKPGPGFSVAEHSEQLVASVRAACGARVKASRSVRRVANLRAPSGIHPETVLAFGASLGGTQALVEVVGSLPAECPGVLLVQHMPALFTSAFAKRLDQNSALEVREAEQGDQVTPGVVLLAPGDRHMVVVRGESGLRIDLRSGPEVSGHRPSVDVLFSSVAKSCGSHAVAAVLTGMGRDGASGLASIRAAGGETFVQDEASSVVFGMGREALAREAAVDAVPLSRIAEHALRLAARRT